MSNTKVKCLVCKGEYFRKGYYDVDVDVDIYSVAYNNVNETPRYESSIDVTTEISHDITSKGELEFRLISDDNNKYYDDYSDVHRYVCEECGFIMTFTKEKDLKSKRGSQKQKQKDSAYDWTNFK